MTTIIAGLSVVGVGVGFAMQGVLGNLVAGLVIIFTKPFRVGEYVDLLSVEGSVDKIELFTTTLRHADLSRIVIPNRKIIGEILHNYGTVRQLDLAVGVAYDSNLTETIAVVRELLNQHPRVLKEPAPLVGISMLADSSINLAVKPWTTVADYGPAGAELYQTIVERLRERNITIPFPQHEVRLLEH
jgi:small conductance mechanosensitive channel